MSDAIVSSHAPARPKGHQVELRKEAYAMGLYVAICLLAALTAVTEHDDGKDIDVLKIVWGTTVGLAVAHWFAFRVSARLVAAGRIRRHDAETAVAQFVGAVAVALLATLPVLLLPVSSELDVARWILAGFVGIVGYAVARSGDASRRRSVVYGLSVLIVAAGVALTKNLLVGH
jgi:hypothetical protein